MSVTRRNFLHVSALTVVGGFLHYRPLLILSQATCQPARCYQGRNLAGWETVLGDGLYTGSGETPPTTDDIQTLHFEKYSELQANIHVRRVMAHNISFRRVIRDDALQHVHLSKYQFRIPFQPSTANVGLNGQTVEGHLAIWDGRDTRRDYITGWQWLVNPWDTVYGDVRMWVGEQWVTVGHFAPDSEWHMVQMRLDIQAGEASVIFDDVAFRNDLTVMPRPADWGPEIAARLAAENISIWPGETGPGSLHRTQFRKWSWDWRA